MKATVYVETTIAGHLTGRLPKDPIVAGQMLLTRDWWQHRRAQYECFTSQRVLEEAGRGDPLAIAERLAALADLPILEPADLAQVEVLADLLLARNALPAKARVDSLHLATAAATGMTYLLTWNCRHLANVAMRGRIERACRDCEFEPPLICTPAELDEEDRP